jgi:hypothetical protein
MGVILKDGSDDSFSSVIHYIFESYTRKGVGIVTGYGLYDRMIGVRFQEGAGNFSL